MIGLRLDFDASATHDPRMSNNVDALGRRKPSRRAPSFTVETAFDCGLLFSDPNGEFETLRCTPAFEKRLLASIRAKKVKVRK